MKLNANEIPSGAKFSGHLCIVGAGAAGIAIAREFAGSSIKVFLLEAGDYDFTDESQSIYQTEPVEVIPEGALNGEDPSFSRQRYFGGSTNCWGGWCRPLDEIDFAKRSWVHGSGWPITQRDLVAYYRKAADLVEISPFDLQDEQKFSDDLETRFFHFSPPTRFGEVYRASLTEAGNIQVVTNASVVRFNSDSTGTVKSVLVKNSQGDEMTFSAHHFVLACGGIENPRLLLNSRGTQSEGLGNQNDLVGRFFMEHPTTSPAAFLTTVGSDWVEPFARTDQSTPKKVFVTSPSFQERFQTLNYSCEVLVAFEDLKDGAIGESLAQFSGDRKEKPVSLVFVVRTEMHPHAENRICLGETRDRLGLNKARVQLTMGLDDLSSVVKSTEGVIRGLSARGVGRGKIDLVDETRWPKWLSGSNHHLGTTRMAATEKEGVVDRNCKVFGLKNLFVAGSSVFTTGGYANPTLTIVALALRLADHLKSEFRR